MTTHLAGSFGERALLGDGGPGTEASLKISDIAVDKAGNVFIADTLHGRVRKVDGAGAITTVAGGGTSTDDGVLATSASLLPSAVRVDGNGNLFVVDAKSQRVRRVGPAGTITTVAGNGTRGFSGDGGPAVDAQLDFGTSAWEPPGGLALDVAGTLFIFDAVSPRVRKVDVTGIITTVAGSGEKARTTTGVPATSTSVYPLGMVVDANGDLLLSDPFDHRVLQIDAVGSVIPTSTTTSTTTIAPPRAMQVPESTWAQPAQTPLDGIGSWLGVVKDPAAAAGQSRATYVYGHIFDFINSTAKGSLSLVTDPAGKFALFSVREEDGTAHNALVPFEWAAGKFYFPLVY
ncbi:MAG: hypothetical protein LC733_01680, partial [Actinobacteria bacterium]|nr:hypothetical protein [Actinomycetota bacterium]